MVKYHDTFQNHFQYHNKVDIIVQDVPENDRNNYIVESVLKNKE